MIRVEITYRDGVNTSSTSRFQIGKEAAETINNAFTSILGVSTRSKALVLSPDSEDPLVLRIPSNGRLEVKAI
jgi:hypothetical protein